MELHKVTLEKTDTCLTYVLKRLGLQENMCKFENIHDYFTSYTFARRKNKLEIGDVLLWEKDIVWQWLPWSIDADGGIEWRNVPTGFHFGIYEGDGLFSDCSRLVVKPHPTLRMRRVSMLQKNPDAILVLSEESSPVKIT